MRRVFLQLLATALLAVPAVALAATAIPFTINLSKPVNVTTTGGTPRIALDVGGVTRYANYASGTGTAALTFTYPSVAGDVDLDGITVSSPIQLNGGAIADLAGNPLTNLTFTPPNTANVKVNYPSLGMDFVADADGRYTLNGTAYNTLPAFLTAAGGTFTRNSIGTYFDSAGVLRTATANTPRFDWDPVTHAAKGVLIEEARANLLTYSNQIDHASWNRAGIGIAAPSVTANDATAPDGTLSAERADFSATTTTEQQGMLWKQFQSTPTIGTIYTVSVYIRSVSGAGTVYLGLTEGGPPEPGTFNACNVTTAWQRCSVSRTVTKSTQLYIEIGPDTRTSFAAPQPSTQSAFSVYIWGAQAELGSFPTSYIPTTTAAVTRAADVLGIPYSSWFDATKGTWMADAYNSQNATNGRVIGTNGNASATFIAWQGTSGGAIVSWNGSNSLIASVSPVATASVSAKMAMKWSTSGPYRSLVVNAGTVSTNALSSTPGTSFYVGASPSSDYIDSWVRKIKYYPVDVPNTQLQLLTQ